MYFYYTISSKNVKAAGWHPMCLRQRFRYRAIPNGVTITDQPGTHWLTSLPPLRRPPYYMTERYRAIPNGVTITDQPGTHWLTSLPPLRRPPYYVTERYRAIPNGVTITHQPGTHWLAALPPAEKPPAAEPSGAFRLGFGKKRGRKEDLHKERRRLTASVTFLFIRYLPDLNSQ